MKLLRTLFVASSVLALSATTLSAQAAQQVTCKDGAKSKGGRGACSSHGGIAVAAAKVDTKAAKAEVKADTKVAKTEVKADAKAAKAEAKTDAKVQKTETAAATKVAKHAKAKTKAKA
jgi:hypothetical protein